MTFPFGRPSPNLLLVAMGQCQTAPKTADSSEENKVDENGEVVADHGAEEDNAGKSKKKKKKKKLTKVRSGGQMKQSDGVFSIINTRFPVIALFVAAIAKHVSRSLRSRPPAGSEGG